MNWNVDDRHDYADWEVLNHQQKPASFLQTHTFSSLPFALDLSPIRALALYSFVIQTAAMLSLALKLL